MKKTGNYLLVLILCFCMLAGCGKQSANVQITEMTSNNKVSSLRITEMTANDKVSPLGIDEAPYFSWKMQSDEEGQKQTAYQIVVSDSRKKLEKKKYVWDSGKVPSDKSVAIPYEGKKMKPENVYYWQVRVWDKEGEEAVSEPAVFETGKLGQNWKKTKWITAPALTGEDVQGTSAANMEMECVSTISYDFKMERTKTGFVWGAEDGQFGRHYKWCFEAAEDQVQLVISYMDDEDVLEEVSIFLEQGADEFLEQEHSVCINIEENKASTYVDGILVSKDISLENAELGEIGFWVTRGEYKAWYDNICIKNLNGEVLCQENFEEKENIFSPYYMKIEEGWGRADAGYIITPGAEQPAPMFRKEFKTKKRKEIESVRLYASALGIFDVYINGRDINEFYGAPGQSVYSKEVYYRTYDITEYIQAGENAVGFMLGHGRYDRAKGEWGDRLGLYAQIVIQYKNGRKQVIGTDESWSVCTEGPIRSDDIFYGEFYDARYEQTDWSLAEFNEQSGSWRKAEHLLGKEELVKKAAPDHGVTCIETVTPISVTEPMPGVFVYDFGKNINGVCRLKLYGKAGDTVIMRHGEFLNQENLRRQDDAVGTIWTRNLFTSDNTDYYTFKEDGMVTYTPAFTYRGFRYLQITGVEDAPGIQDVEGLVLATGNERTGYFECSDENMNRLYEAIYLSQLNNYVDIPTDCAQRDERLGWAGDAQVYAYTGSLNANTANFMYKYIDALRVSQNSKGVYPHIAPFSDSTDAANGWSDAGIILVWEMYQQYGNPQVIEENLEAMCRYVDHLVETSEGFIRKQKNYNDHNALSYMDDACCNTAQCTYVAGLLTKMCGIVEEKELEEKYGDIYKKYLNAWRENFLNEDGSIGEWMQSEYALALAYGLYPEELEESGAEKLNISVEASGYHISTGYITTPHILSLLCKYGYTDSAYKMIQQTGYSSWNYMLEQGATTLTEGWHTIMEDEEGMITINGSLNHVALGAVGQWFYTDVLGIRRDENNPGYKHFYLEPQVGGGLTYAKGSYDSIYGRIESSWEVTEEGMEFCFVIPANTSATVTLPGEKYREITLEAGTHDFIIPFFSKK